MDDSGQATDNDSIPAEDVATLKLQLELEKLERRWTEEKQPYLPYENVNVPLSWFLGFIMFAVPIFIIGLGLSRYAEGEKPNMGFVVVGAFFLVGSVVVWIYHSRRDRRYKEAKQAYEQRREQLLQDIAACEEMAEKDK